MNLYGAKIKFFTLRGLGIFCLLFTVFFSVAEGDISSVYPEEALKLGERMYREGILPSGAPMEAIVKGDIPVEGTAFSCASCHLRSGLGSFEGLVVTPPTNGTNLFRPLKRFYRDVEVLSAPPLRPAYTDSTLADVIRGGVDPSGRTISETMPRYLLQDEDMVLLVAYLKSLSSQFSPGATSTTLRFATIVTEDVSAEEREAMLSPLENYILSKNSQSRTYKKPPSNVRMEGWFAATHLELSLSQWVLKGPAETWRSQLEEHYRKEPVFALIGGIVKGDWRPIHDFSEENHIPSLFPITDFPVVSENDWYTLYLSKGFYREGEGAARYLNSIAEMLEGKAIVEVVRDSIEGRTLSIGFQETWLETGHQPVVSVTLKKGETLTAKLLDQVLAGKKQYTLVLWDGPEALAALEAIAASANKPESVLVSSGYLGKSIRTLNEGLRDITYITYPFGLSQEKRGYKYDIPLMKNKVSGDAEKILKRTYSLLNILTQALIEMRGNYYRDNFFDVIGMMKDQRDPLYERLSFGPGQRYASKGCYIVQLGKGPNPELIKRSDWVIY